MNNTQKSQVIGYLFLVAATMLEICVLKTICNVDLYTGKMITMAITPVIFNFTIWCLAIRYHMTKEHCSHESHRNSPTV